MALSVYSGAEWAARGISVTYGLGCFALHGLLGGVGATNGYTRF